MKLDEQLKELQDFKDSLKDHQYKILRQKTICVFETKNGKLEKGELVGASLLNIQNIT